MKKQDKVVILIFVAMIVMLLFIANKETENLRQELETKIDLLTEDILQLEYQVKALNEEYTKIDIEEVIKT